TLSSSDDVQDRETEKGRLEEAFETCDRDLDKLIVQHYAELTTAIRTYQSITERITSSRNKIKQLLDEIESIKQVPQRLETYMASKHYLHATDMLVTAVESLEGPLFQVEGLGDLRLELKNKKLNIHLVLIDELHRHLYIKSTSRLGHKNKDKNAGRVSG
ncbi:Exocyst complex component 4, partial [Xenoophorus captivus]